MRRKPASRWMCIGAGAASWVASAALAQGALGSELDWKARHLEDRIEMQLRGSSPPPSESPPSERLPEEAIEPWELVSV